jgi:MerR family transcriptional regulator, copper efflux regulator
VNVETIRYYERIGLLERPRTAAGYRLYSDEALDRLRFIRKAQAMGFSLKEIAELSGLAESGATCEAMCARMDQKLAELNEQLAELTTRRDRLAQLLDCSPRNGGCTNCEVLRELSA